MHKAYLIWALVSLPAAILMHTLWNTEGWHTAVRQLMGVSPQ